MMSVDAGPDVLPVIVAKLEGVAVYLDNWGDHRARERQCETPGALCESSKSCGSLMFSFTNSNRPFRPALSGETRTGIVAEAWFGAALPLAFGKPRQIPWPPG